MVDIFNLATLAGGSSSTQHIIKAYYICIRGLHGVYISSQKQALCSLHQPVFHQAAAYLFQRRVCITSIQPARQPVCSMDVFHIEKRSETIATRCTRNSHSMFYQETRKHSVTRIPFVCVCVFDDDSSLPWWCALCPVVSSDPPPSILLCCCIRHTAPNNTRKT